MSYYDDAVSPGASNSDNDEEMTPGPRRLPSCIVRTASSVPSLDVTNALIATVVSEAVTQAIAGIKGDMPCAELLDDVEVPPTRASFVTSVKALGALRAKPFSSEVERKAAVLPDLIAIREAILALQEGLFKSKLMPLVERIDAFAQ